MGLEKSRLFWGYWFPVLVYCLAIFVQSAYPSPDGLPSFPYSDKVMHFLAYGVMGGLFYRALGKTFPNWNPSRTVSISILLTTLYGASDEFHQAFVAARTADVLDLAADFVGGAIGALCCFLLGAVFVRRTNSRLPD